MDHAEAAQNSPRSILHSPTGPRRRGRARTSPQNLIVAAKYTRQRSVTGCITCRRRKKKCDEAKPACTSCDNFGVICEGYQQKVTGLGQARNTNAHRLSFKLDINGINTSEDRIFFEHYISCLSKILSANDQSQNEFRDLIVPIAIDNVGVMHSLLALSAYHIEYHSPYGRAILAAHPESTIATINQRMKHHRQEGLNSFYHEVEENDIIGEGSTMAAWSCQILFFLLQSLAEGQCKGEHRIHLHAFRRIVGEIQPRKSDFWSFITEYFNFHISVDRVFCNPDVRFHLYLKQDRVEQNIVEEGNLTRHVGLLDPIFKYTEQITRMRSRLRERLITNVSNAMDHVIIHEAIIVDSRIREWNPHCSTHDPRYVIGLIYKQMAWVYLMSTVLSPNIWTRTHLISQAIGDGLSLMKLLASSSPSQKFLLTPALVIGCVAINHVHRADVIERISVIKGVTQFGNAHQATELLKEVWKLIDVRDKRSWDWQNIAQEVGLDLLPA